MAFADTLKGLIGKGKQAAAQNADKIEQAVDKAGDLVDKKTQGKYADKVNKVQQAAKNQIPKDGNPGSGPTGTGPTGTGPTGNGPAGI